VIDDGPVYPSFMISKGTFAPSLTLFFNFKMEPSVWFWNQLFGFLKPLVPYHFHNEFKVGLVEH
jgi:hypothetical protein